MLYKKGQKICFVCSKSIHSYQADTGLEQLYLFLQTQGVRPLTVQINRNINERHRTRYNAIQLDTMPGDANLVKKIKSMIHLYSE